MLPLSISEHVAEQVGESILKSTPISGGSIGNAYRVQTASNVYCLKYGVGAVARTFEAEARGLHTLRLAAVDLHVPAVITVQSLPSDDAGYLMLEWIEEGRPTEEFWTRFGTALAHMHRAAGERYGGEQDNFIGSLPQYNAWMEVWPDFFRSRRLEPQVRLARHSGAWRHEWDPLLDSLYRRLPELLPATPPASVLHGDLWSGNFMVTSNLTAALIDPAAYQGHRETDLAMTELFGGFDRRFYQAYGGAWPLEPGYHERRSIYNLYHLVNHLNHFGVAYASQVHAVLKEYA